jgi:RNA polymerase sigma factor (sigma-70 family)
VRSARCDVRRAKPLEGAIIGRWERGPDVESQHAADLELAQQCASGNEQAWERFIRDYRPILYRAAQALDPSGGAREIADSLYAELFGIRGGGDTRSLFRYFQGRSSLATWLRAVLAQRYVDHLRMRRRLDVLPDEDDASRGASHHPHPLAVAAGLPDPDRPRYLALMRGALGRAVATLAVRDRLRLGCYYLQELTLAETGRLLSEHEATVSRQLARTRRALREAVERDLRDEGRLNEAQIAECFACTAADPGPLDLTHVLSAVADRKEPATGRSG